MVYARQSKSHKLNTNRVDSEPFLPFTRGKRKVQSGTVFEAHALVTGFEVAIFIEDENGNPMCGMLLASEPDNI